ncbi:ADP-ribosylation factor-binding protein GGA3 [Tribolium madens]|uniref:ADP-ribosylation factor-binding protein GGA3 n=1 Tax=Tribolium madens TaxID=41895 RepID=UPI001CF72539|nr:ADP-ribosylation factor-binding protein GGA3 [Tribolium madens]
MDLVTQTSLEALLLKATNSQNQNIDTAAVEAFCALVNKEKDGAHIGVKVIANRLPSGNEKELLQTLNILDTCMSKCGTAFQSEVGKFRFLNEMIKLVSPKYLGSQTPLLVKQKVLQLMYIWTLDYPKETKIKEAYDMLRKQGVIKEIPNPNIVQNVNIPRKKVTNSVFHDEEKSKILQKLLQSKDPEDIQAANWLIKSMVKEDDKRAELKSRRVSELESVQNNVRLLNEMLDSYKPGISSADELDLIKELHQSCERLRQNLMKLTAETQQNEEILGDVLQASDELSHVFSKYNKIIVQGNSVRDGGSNALLDFEGSDEAQCQNTEPKEIDVLCDIFNASNIPDSADILQPVSVLTCDKSENGKEVNKFKALEELDILSEHLIKENLPSNRQGSFNNKQEKIPMNRLTKLSETKPSQSNGKNETISDSLNLDLSYLISKPKEEPKTNIMENSIDDCLVDIADEKMLEADETTTQRKPSITETPKNHEIKLNDIFIKLEDIKPSPVPPLTILNERNGITITLHFVKDKPRDDVHVFVVTTINKNDMPLTNYLFQAVVPKGCKVKLQPPSATTLPAHNPFLPPSAITQIMLIANPDDVQVFLKFFVSFVMDEETCTEIGEVETLPMV